MKKRTNNYISANHNIADFVIWNRKYELGITIIDEQHKKLVEMTNRLFQASIRGSQMANSVFAEIIKEVTEYVKYHFAAEEAFMLKIGYPELEEHKKEHREFIRYLLHAIKEFEEGHTFVPKNFAIFLKDWTLQHIAMSDRRIAVYFFKLKKQINQKKMELDAMSVTT